MRIFLLRSLFWIVLHLLVTEGSTAFGQRLVPPPPLEDALTEGPGNQIGEGTRNLVICIHGWNPSGHKDAYKSGTEWNYLVDQLKIALAKQSTETWSLVLYHWEDDANTGFINSNGFLISNAIRAARIADGHGSALGPRLPDSLRRIHLIAHSAGAWCARRTAEWLIANRPYLVVQVTLLDPFIPEEVEQGDGLYSINKMSEMAQWDGSERLNLLENYYADDLLTLGTQSRFDWKAKGVNLQVEWSNLIPPYRDLIGNDIFYDDHSGPILFYGDTTYYYNNPNLPLLFRLYGPYDVAQVGWSRSLYQAQFSMPRFTTQPVASTVVSAGSKVTLSANALGANSYQWFKDRQLISATGSSFTFTANDATQGEYVVRASGQNGILFSDTASVRILTPPPPAVPVITTVSPNLLPTSSAPQAIRIIGSGFTSSSTLLFNGSIASDPARLTFVSANEIGYNVIVPTSGEWSVKVINGTQESNVKNFTVQAPSTSSGSLNALLAPQGALNAGAQWRVDGGNYRNHGEPVISLTPGTHTVSFKPIAGYTTPADQTATVTANAQTTVNATYTPVAATTFTLNLSTDPTRGSIYRNPNRNTFSPGETVRLTANNETGWHFDHWSGDASGSSYYVDVVMNSDKTVTANWASGDASLVTVAVTLTPPEAVTAGARWRLSGSAWLPSGQSLTGQYLGDHYLEFADIAGWVRPASFSAAFVRGATNLTATYTQIPQPTYLQVVITPPEAVTAGAQWRVDGGAWQAGGVAISISPSASRLIEFKSVSGWAAPEAQTVSILNGQTKVVSGTYRPPPGIPLISSVSPGIGALAGGTMVSLSGANFVAPATVIIGGQVASNVVVSSSTLITCFTPSNSSYGTAPVVVQAAGGAATNLNGFAYGFPRGTGLELAGSIGGSTYCLVAQGNYLFVGEGASFVVFDVTNPASPAPVTRLALPGRALGLALFSANGRSYACVANDDAGVQIVDVTSPVAPVLKGYYQTPGNSMGVAVLGGFAYVAGGSSGLQMLDLSNPVAPVLIGSVPAGADVYGLAVKATVNGVFAYLVTANGLQIVDVSTPAAPSLRGSLAFTVGSGPGWHQIALVGNRAYIASLFSNLKVVDVSDADHPTNTQTLPSGGHTAVFAVGTTLYARYSGGFEIYNASGSTLQFIGGNFNSGTYGYGNHIAIANGAAFVSNLDQGFYAVSLSNPGAPAFLTTYSGESGSYSGLALYGQFAYAACNNGGLKAFNVVNPALPVRTFQSSVSALTPSEVIAANGRAYACGGNSGQGIGIFDLGVPATPSTVGNISSALIFGSRLGFANGDLLVGGTDFSVVPYAPTLAIINISNPASPTLRGKRVLPDHGLGGGAGPIANNSTVACAYVLNSQSIQIVNIGQPNNPLIIGSIESIGSVLSLALSLDGRYLFVGNGSPELCLRIYDLVNPNAPSMIYSNQMGAVWAIALSGNTAHLGVKGSVFTYDISDPTTLVLKRSYLTPWIPRHIEVAGDLVYVANDEAGLTILRMTDMESPEVLITNPTFASITTNTTGTINLGGSVTDNKAVVRVTWANSAGGGGEVSGTDSWLVSGITLQPGTNILTVAAVDAAGNVGTDTLTVIYNAPRAGQSIVFSTIADRVIGDAAFTPTALASSGLPVNFSIVSGPATMAGNAVTVTGVGAVTVRASQPGDASFNPAADVEKSFNVGKASQTITIGPIPAKQVGDPPLTVDAAASSGGAVSFSIVSGPAAVSGNTVTLTGAAGAVILRATQDGNASYLPATADVTFTVGSASQVISFGPLNRQVLGDAPFTLFATSSSGLPVRFSILSGPAVVDGNIVTVTGTGLVVVRASQPGSISFGPAPTVDQVFIVTLRENQISELHRFQDGRLGLVFVGEYNRPYRVEFSTNLTDWQPVITNTVSSLGTMEITDASGTNQTRRFYRVKGL